MRKLLDEILLATKTGDKEIQMGSDFFEIERMEKLELVRLRKNIKECTRLINDRLHERNVCKSQVDYWPKFLKSLKKVLNAAK